ncbi:hypothetical protein SAMN05444487_105115 [Marininema mesophilum]|uniref:Uncharacterized protein n=1 Tax=Marininema mesophilum TaxID=1048340 RepID=A0A1H2VJB4_9BACL|nr:hypothetical protein [Marininema mesophilum]SDW67969.1 hypothetical protein SAMN05444487_105115 [Marininema mesophilum]
MRIFPHGNVVNFNDSVREMTASELEQLLTTQIEKQSAVVTGHLDMKAEAVYLYGQAEQVRVDEEGGEVIVTSRSEDEPYEARFSFDDLLLSHEMHFDIIVDGEETIRYPVYYVTFAQEGEEITLFFAQKEGVNEPLHYVTEFWAQAGEMGRDATFDTGGCSLPSDFRSRLKNC